MIKGTLYKEMDSAIKKTRRGKLSTNTKQNKAFPVRETKQKKNSRKLCVFFFFEIQMLEQNTRRSREIGYFLQQLLLMFINAVRYDSRMDLRCRKHQSVRC